MTTTNVHGKVTGHEDTARGTVAYVTDEGAGTTARIYMQKEDDGTWTVASNTVNGRGAVVASLSTRTHLDQISAQALARRYWHHANEA